MINMLVWTLSLIRPEVDALADLCERVGLDIASPDVRDAVMAHGKLDGGSK